MPPCSRGVARVGALLVTLCGCTSPSRDATGPAFTTPTTPRSGTPALADAALLPVAPGEPTWTGAAGSAGGGRWGLVVVADRHASDASMDLEGGPRALELLRGALGQGLGIAGERLRVLTGAQVTEAAVEREVRAIGAALRGPDNLVLVYYYGHGWTSAGGQLELFTHDTERQGAGFVRTLSHNALGASLARLRNDARARGDGARVVSVVDACRPGMKAPPSAVKLVPLEVDAEVFAASAGQLANEDQFVGSFCDALRDGARREQTLLGDVFDACQRTVSEKTGGAQVPDLAQGERGLVLRTAGDLGLEVQAFDPVGQGRAIEGATVVLGGRAAPTGSFAGLRPGRYAWQVEAPGYVWRTGEVELTPERSGQVLRVPLLPRLVVLTGEVVNPHGTVARVRLAGTRPEGTIDGYHVLEATVTGSGRFVLRPPALADDAEVVVEVAGVEAARRSPRLGAADHVVSGDVRVPRVDLGRLDLGERGAARRLEDLGTAGPSGPIALPALRFSDENGAAAYERVVRPRVARGTEPELRKALAGLEPLGPRVLEASRKDFLALRARLVLEVARLRRAHDSSGACEELAAAVEADPVNAEARVEAARWLVSDGRAASERGEHALACDALARAVALAPTNQSRLIVEEQARAWTRRVEAAVARALQDDGWADAEAQLRAGEAAVGAAPLAIAQATLDRERMPRAARELLREAHAAYADGRLEEAEGLYERARPDCNAFHGPVVDRQLADLAPRLFQRSFAQADARQAAGDAAGALAALLRAWRYDPDLVDAELDLLAAPADAWPDAPPPQVVIESPSPGDDGVVAPGDVTVRVRVESPLPVTVRIDGVRARRLAGGRYEATFPIAIGDARVVRVEVGDRKGRQTASTLSLSSPLPRGVRVGDVAGEYVNEQDGSILVVVPSGTFRMGRDAGDADEKPAHEVRLTGGYFVGKYEVTWAQYRAFCRARGLQAPSSMISVHKAVDFEATDQHPVFNVSWDDAQAYCAWAGLRLPSEAEWERAARGSDGRTYPWGNQAPGTTRCNLGSGIELLGFVDASDGHHFTAPVGSFQAGASPFGAHDVAGNVWEWCQDWHGAYSPGAVVDPRGPAEGWHRVARGGSWGLPAWSALATGRRVTFEPTSRLVFVGFRVARSFKD